MVLFRLLTAAAMLVLAALTLGCASYSTFGFPVEEGSISAGRQAFIDHSCHRCHTVAGVSLPDVTETLSPRFELGGETGQVMAYSGLVTSIINPNDHISQDYLEQQRLRGNQPRSSPMPMSHIETMTVRQVIDIVAFLDSRYVLIDDYEPEL